MQEITITMRGDGDVELIRKRTLDDTEALSVFIALGRTLGDDPPKRRTRRTASTPADDPAGTSATPDVE